MPPRSGVIVVVVLLGVTHAVADEVLYRYEADVAPYDESAGWLIFNSCEAPCSESLEDGCFVLRWPRADDFANYHLWIARTPEVPICSQRRTLW